MERPLKMPGNRFITRPFGNAGVAGCCGLHGSYKKVLKVVTRKIHNFLQIVGHRTSDQASRFIEKRTFSLWYCIINLRTETNIIFGCLCKTYVFNEAYH